MSTHTSQLWLDDIHPGQRIALPDTDCSAARVASYADLFDARHPIHVDEEFAKGTRYGKCIAHGPLPLAASLASLGDIFGTALIVMTRIGGWDFFGPVPVDTSVPSEAHVTHIGRGRGAVAEVTLEIRLLGADGELLQRGEVGLLVRARPRNETGQGGNTI